MKFIVETQRSYYRTFTYEVEAESPEEARAQVEKREVEESHYSSLNWDGDEDIVDVRSSEFVSQGDASV